MNNIDILEEKIKIIESLCTDDCINKETVIKPLKYAISNLIAENKDLKEENEGLKTKLDTLIEKYKDLKEMLKHRIEYTNKLEKDLFQNASNYVIPKSKVKAKIEEVEQWGLYNMKIPKLSTLDERLGAKIGIKYALQSLLGKE